MLNVVRVFAVLVTCFPAVLPAVAIGGGGPENVLLVVNRQSRGSMCIANHFIRLRHIPPDNVLYLPSNPKKDTIDTEKTDVETFRRQILKPVMLGVLGRNRTGRIDYVVYSSDFPWQIDLMADVNMFFAKAELAAERRAKDDPAAKDKPPKPVRWPTTPLTPFGSINGLTYLWQDVMIRDPGYMRLKTNQYMRRAIPQQKETPTLGFKSSYRFGPHGELLERPGRFYMLSAVLGVTTGRGNSVPEVLEYLRRGAAADGTHPKGTIYLVRNPNVRSRVRDRAFPEVVRQLKELGVAAEIIDGKVPRDKDDVQGVMLGIAKFDWKASGSTILPGAICDHLTSFGGVMTEGAAQTPLSEFLRYGAGGASGTVYEPFAIQEKFPFAMMHVHYARGCTLGEAFYQSVYGPYQLLIVGDPLCRPWADIPSVDVQGVQPGATVKGLVVMKPSATVPGGSAMDHFELFIDGRRAAQCKPGETFDLDTTGLPDGYHELRLVAVQAGLIQSQGRRIVPITTANHGRVIDVSVEPQGEIEEGQPLVVTASSPGAIGIVLRHNTLLLGTITGGLGHLRIDSRALGTGPVRLRVLALGKSGSRSNVIAKPIELTVRPAEKAKENKAAKD